jgi:hypothetical protein
VIRYVIRRHNKLYVTRFGTGTWTSDVWRAREFETKRGTLAYLAAAEIPADECEIAATAWVTSDEALASISEHADVVAIVVHDPRSLTTVTPGPTDQGLASAGRMINLEELEIFAHAVTDIGLLHLAGLTGLRKLHIKGTRVTDEGVKRLREVLAECKITRIPRPRYF